MASDFSNDFAASEGFWTTMQVGVKQLSIDHLERQDRAHPNSSFHGPLAPVVREWIVQLDTESAENISDLTEIDSLLSEHSVQFKSVKGLGVAGLVLVQSESTTSKHAEEALHNNRHVKHFEANRVLSVASLAPNDERFSEMTNFRNLGSDGSALDVDVDADEAWQTTIGSPSIVVGVIDSGIDLTHPDLYANIWINQGEISDSVLDKLVDMDGDGIITFYDLNADVNAAQVDDLNGNGYIDAEDLRRSPQWFDGIDTDRNGYVDDFFGWDFRSQEASDLQPSFPTDRAGHGTHVAGIIGAMGNNQRGVVGLNWQTSLMSLKFLDENNRGDTASAIQAVNYATMMRTRFNTNVRVLNASWGIGSSNTLLRDSIQAAGEAEISFVAAAGNGNVLGQGVDNDFTPFYPGSFELSNVLSVGASDGQDRLAPFSNFGERSVDLVAPGVGVLSTLTTLASKDDRLTSDYRAFSGTSMAAPHVAGAVALIYSAFPNASMEQVHLAILNGVDRPESLRNSRLATQGRLNVRRALDSDVFAPRASIVGLQKIITSVNSSSTLRIVFEHRDVLDETSIRTGSVIVRRQWGPRDVLVPTLDSGSVVVSNGGKRIEATYLLNPPGGNWDALDFGDYVISTVANIVRPKLGPAVSDAEIDRFHVRIQDPTVIYVDSTLDSPAGNSLRAAIEKANQASPDSRTIILEARSYPMTIAPVIDPKATFSISTDAVSCSDALPSTGWTTNLTGDFDILGNMRILGDSVDTTKIDGSGLDRVFRVHTGASLSVERLTIARGIDRTGRGGGGILSVGNLNLTEARVEDSTVARSDSSMVRGGGIAAWDGRVEIQRSHITRNAADFGGGVFVCGNVVSVINQSTIEDNRGGGVTSYSKGKVAIENSTISLNFGLGVSNVARDYPGGNGPSYAAVRSRDGSYIVFLSESDNLAPGDGVNTGTDLFLFATESGTIQRITTDRRSNPKDIPAINADGRFIAYWSSPDNTSTNGKGWLLDRQTNQLKAFSPDTSPSTVNGLRGPATITDDGKLIAFTALAKNGGEIKPTALIYDSQVGSSQILDLRIDNAPVSVDLLNLAVISGNGRSIYIAADKPSMDSTRLHPLYRYDTLTSKTELLSFPQLNGSVYQPSSSFNGERLTFLSDALDLAGRDSDRTPDVFFYDRVSGAIRRLTQTNLTGYNVGRPSISPDGAFVSFSTDVDLLSEGLPAGVSNVYLYDVEKDQLSRVQQAIANGLPNGNSRLSQVGDRGEWVLFDSSASNLVSGDLPAEQLAGADVASRIESGRDIFLYDSNSKTTTVVSQFTQNTPLSINHSTIAFNNGESAVQGNIEIASSLFVGNVSSNDLGLGVRSLGFSAYNTVYAEGQKSSSDLPAANYSQWIGEYSRSPGLPPTYPLVIRKRGTTNPLIDAGRPTTATTFDQWGRQRTHPDVGAMEAVGSSIVGEVFADFNSNGIRDNDEPRVADVAVFVDADNNGRSDLDEAKTLSTKDTLATPNVDETGIFRLSDLPDGISNLRIIPPSGWSVGKGTIARVLDGTNQLSEAVQEATISPGGRFVALRTKNNIDPNDADRVYIFDSNSKLIRRIGSNSPLVTGARNLSFSGNDAIVFESNNDVYRLDLATEVNTLLSRNNSGSVGSNYSRNPSSSENGDIVVFNSLAGNLGDDPHPIDNAIDTFVWRRADNSIRKITKALNGSSADGDSELPSVSSDGHWVAFVSEASNLVAGDSNGKSDVFLANLQDSGSISIERVSQNEDGSQRLHPATRPTISGNGELVAYYSTDNSGKVAIYTYVRTLGTTDRLEIPLFIDRSMNLSVSADGRYITFVAQESALPPNRSEYQTNIYVYDRSFDRFERISIPVASNGSVGSSYRATISADGAIISFLSSSDGLVVGDTNSTVDAFFVANPYQQDSRTIRLQKGEIEVPVTIGIYPDPGVIAGAVFEDVILNGLFDEEELGFLNWSVYLDINRNGRRDLGEPSTRTDENGSYRFSNVLSYRGYLVGVEAPAEWEPSIDRQASSLFLSAGGSIDRVDIGLRRRSNIGQFQNSSVQGTVFIDLDDDGVQDWFELGHAGKIVFLDANGNGTRDDGERQTTTDTRGNYLFSSVGAGIFDVRIANDLQVFQTSPRSSSFQEKPFRLSRLSSVLQTPVAIATLDIDGQKGLDLVTLLQSGQSLVYQLNDGSNQFESFSTFDLSRHAAAPIAMLAENLDGRGQLDLVILDRETSTLLVYNNFDGVQRDPSQTIRVQNSTNTFLVTVEAADIERDGDIDLVVVDQESNQIALLRNDGNGNLRLTDWLSSNGVKPYTVAAGDFNGDGFNDLIVSHNGSVRSGRSSPSLTILEGFAGGNFKLATTLATSIGTASFYYTDLAAADLNQDGRLDLVSLNIDGRIDVRYATDAGLGARVNYSTSAPSATRVTLVDIDGDTDIDMIANDNTAKSVSLIRNRHSQGQDDFAPAESVGVGAFGEGIGTWFVAADLLGKRTMDIAVIDSNSNELRLFVGQEAAAGHRIRLDGLHDERDRNFGIRSSMGETLRLNTTELGDHSIRFDPTGIRVIAQKGTTDFSLPMSKIRRITASSASGLNSYEIDNPSTSGLQEVALNSSGELITLKVTGQSVSLSRLDSFFPGRIQSVDSVNELEDVINLSVTDIESKVPNRKLTLALDRNDRIQSSAIWEYRGRRWFGESLIHVFGAGDATIETTSNSTRRNFLNQFDVNLDRTVDPTDVLIIINRLNRRGSEISISPTPGGEEPEPYFFYDVNGDNTLSPIDVLQVINQLRRRTNFTGEGEAILGGNEVDRVMQVPIEEWLPNKRRRS